MNPQLMVLPLPRSDLEGELATGQRRDSLGQKLAAEDPRLETKRFPTR